MRHIAILGMSFCGSTVTSYVLGALPGVANVGESYWAREVGRNTRCHYCGPSCDHWTPEFISSLQADSSGWYQRLSEQMRCDVLVSSDKTPRIVRDLDPTLNMDTLIVFRPPIESFRSYKSKTDDDWGIEGYLQHWAKFYREAGDMPVKGKQYWLDFTRFRSNPAQELRALCDLLQLPFDANALEYWKRPQHLIGGHFNAYNRFRSGQEAALMISPEEGAPHTGKRDRRNQTERSMGAI